MNNNTEPTIAELAKMIDHSLLHPTLTKEQVKEGCILAVRFDVASVCVKPCFAPQAAVWLRGSGVDVCSVAGFPHGSSSTVIKIREAVEVIFSGGKEIDMVVNIGDVLAEDWDAVSSEIEEMNSAVLNEGGILKVIFENDFLEDRHIIKLCEICGDIGVAFVKTSTGYGFVKDESGTYSYKGATDHHLKLMREHSPSSVQIKAAGGVRTLDDLLRVRALGVTRVGATATEAILREAADRGFS